VVDHDWKRRWSEVEPERRRRIARAIHRGEAVADVRDAPLALELIEHKLRHASRFNRTRKWLSPRHLLLVAGVSVPVAVVTHDYVPMGIFVGLPLYLFPLQVFLSRLEARTKLALEKNKELAGPVYDRESPAA
jgi:hypothetical protein